MTANTELTPLYNEIVAQFQARKGETPAQRKRRQKKAKSRAAKFFRSLNDGASEESV